MWINKHNSQIKRSDAPFPGEMDDWVYIGDDKEKTQVPLPSLGFMERFEKELLVLAVIMTVAGLSLIWSVIK